MGRAWPALLAGIAVLTGAGIRILSGDALIASTLVYAGGAPQEIPGNRTPEDAVRSFYLALDRGLYEQAWTVSVEPDWAGRALVPYGEAVGAGSMPVPPTSRECFVERMNAELGYGGVWLKLNEVEARRLEERSPAAAPAAVPVAGLRARSACRVRAEGRLLGACTVFGWSKDLEVLRVEDGYRVVLGGTKRPEGLFYQEWFSNVQKIGSLRAADSGIGPSTETVAPSAPPAAAPPAASAAGP